MTAGELKHLRRGACVRFSVAYSGSTKRQHIVGTFIRWLTPPTPSETGTMRVTVGSAKFDVFATGDVVVVACPSTRKTA